MAANATDIITIDAGGRLFKTSLSTVESSGAGFFQALLGQTGASLAGSAAAANTPSAKRARTEDTTAQTDPLFIDCDPDIFSDVLYFMRRNCIAPETKVDAIRLEKLKTEAQYFCYDVLSEACSEALETIRKSLKEALEEEPVPDTLSYGAVIEPDESTDIEIPVGQVLYLSSAVLAGRCRSNRYNNYPDIDNEEEQGRIPGCYLMTAGKQDTGDFQLCYSDNVGQEICVAHVAVDHIHCGTVPINVDFRQDLRICISADASQTNYVTLTSKGSGAWHVHYWLGHPSAIPQLNYQDPPSKRSAIVSTGQDQNEMKSVIAVALAAMAAGVLALNVT